MTRARTKVAELAASKINDIMAEFVPGAEDRAAMLANVSDPKNWKQSDEELEAI